jgi:hypothetical protein
VFLLAIKLLLRLVVPSHDRLRFAFGLDAKLWATS